MLTENDIKAELSYAYLHTIASQAGYCCRPGPQPDRDSVDAVISARGKMESDSPMNSPRLEFQLKATSVIQPTDERFSFELKMKNYNDFRERRYIPAYLMVLILPTNREEWVIHREEALEIRHCAYWCSLLGAPAVTNERTKTVSLLRRNVLTVEALRDLMRLASRFEEVPYAE